jgi:hypothetical protein
MTSKEHDSAVERLRAEVAEQDRLRERYESAIGTSSELGAYFGLRAATDGVAARQAWLHWIGDEGYRGLNAGPFELLAETSAPVSSPPPRAGPPVGRAWVNGHEIGGPPLHLRGLEDSHD